MKIKKTYTLLPIFLVFLCFSGCSKVEVPSYTSTEIPNESIVSEQNTSTDNLKLASENATLPTEDFGTIYLSKEQALEDCEYMWTVLENNYPSFGVPERLYNVDVEVIKEWTYFNINKVEKLPLEDFYTIVFSALYEFKQTYHLMLLPPALYQSIVNQKDFEERGKQHPSYQFVHDWGKSSETYKYIQDVLYKANEENKENINQDYNENENITFSIVDEQTVLLTINNFLVETLNKQQLLNYYEQAKGYKNLIIDISKNGGGSDDFWIDYIVRPNIRTSLTHESICLIKSGEENLSYFEARGNTLTDTFPDEIKWISALPKVNLNDLNGLTSISKRTVTYEPLSKSKASDGKIYSAEAFEGKIYVLIDKPVFSSAESFAKFCKETKFATIVGKTSLGDGGGFSPIICAMPNSGLLFRYAPAYAINADGSCNQEYGTTPDYFCEENETPLDACLRIIKMQSGEVQ